jgi:hypothetical protein
MKLNERNIISSDPDYGHGSELDDADIYYQAWLQRCENTEDDDESVFLFMQ